MKLSDTAIRRPVFAVMLIGGLVLFGVISIGRLGLDLYPRVEFPFVIVTTALDGAAPETVEREVTQVLEEAVNTIESIRSLRSTSSDSLSLLFIEFELECNVGEKAQEVRDKISAVRADLPREVDPPVVDRVDPDATPMLAVMVAGPDSIRTLSEHADKRIKPRLERIAGVGSVELVGDRPRELRIWIDPIRLGGYGLAVDDVLAALEREHVELPGGRIETARSEYTVKTKGKLESADLFGGIVVLERGGRTIHLRDVALVEDGMSEERTVSYLNGRRGVALLIRRQSGENTVAVADAVKAELAEMRGQLPPGYEMIEALDLSRFIRSAVRDVASDLAWGALLAAAVVLLFLRNARSTMITAVIIPASLLGTLTLFYFFGFTLNSMTLMALSLSIGGLIDDAIVLLENAYRHLQTGESPVDAASRATEELGPAVFATNLTNCAVFIPIAFMGGVVGRFFREFGLVAAGAVIVSTLIALTWTPMLCARFLRVQRRQALPYRLMEAGYDRLEAHYRRALAWGLGHRMAVVALALASVAGGIVAARNVRLDFLTLEDRSEFNVWIKMPLGSTVEQTRGAVRAVERELRQRPEVQVLFSTIGAGVQARVNEAQIYVQLVHKSQRHAGQSEIMRDVRRRLDGLNLGMRDVAVEEVPIFNVPGMRNAQIMYVVRGPDVDQLQRYTQLLLARMRTAGGFADLTTSYETGKPEIALEIARERGADLGVPAVQIGRTISALVGGIRATTFEEKGERYDVRVQVQPQYRDDPAKLDLLRVRASSGELVPLRNLVTARVGSGPVQVDRDSRTRAITMLGNLDGKAAGTADEEVVRFGRELGISGEYELEAIGPTKRLRETIAAIGFAFTIALIAMYMILAAQFNSFVHPLTIMLSAPLSFIGAFATVLVAGVPLDLMGQIAFLMLMGVVMKNGILLVDYTNTLRENGRSLYGAVLEAGPTRMRPVLMTTVSTVCSMLPVAFGTGDGSEWRGPMGIITIGGLLTSTLLTLLVVPVVYTLLDDAARALRALVGRGRAERNPAADAADTASDPFAPGTARESEHAFGGSRVVICPTTGQPEEIELDAARATVTTTTGMAELRVARCGHLPAGPDCDQGCLKGVDPRWAREHGLLTPTSTKPPRR
jgi:HAE1 family hydrophobic/amphiphilic exporter-1